VTFQKLAKNITIKILKIHSFFPYWHTEQVCNDNWTKTAEQELKPSCKCKQTVVNERVHMTFTTMMDYFTFWLSLLLRPIVESYYYYYYYYYYY